MDEGFKHFLTCWLAGLLKGLENVDQSSREAVLRECGKGCAHSYTAQLFQEVKRQSTSVDAFLAALALRFPESVYVRTGPREIKVTYSSCACDLVTLGLTQSPTLCQCSAYNLQSNFEQALKIPVEVNIQSSILRSQPNCTFTVLFTQELERIF